jgi:hypothetical protein
VDAQIVFLAVVAARFLLPLLIIRYPLPAILACLVLDGVDQTIFQSFGYDPPGYQGYDKAMDVFYLAVAYTATMRNWTSPTAFRVGRFLYFYRLVGVVAFEYSQARWVLLVFPNTFEYFFIAYEAVRLRWSPARFSLRFWVVVAGLIWVVVKLPQEWWIHIAKLDLTDQLADKPWLWGVIAGLVVLALLLLKLVALPALGPPDHGWRVTADPVPAVVRSAGDLAAWRAAHSRVWSSWTVEKIVLVGLLSVIYAKVIPSITVAGGRILFWVAVFTVVNAALSLWADRRAHSVSSMGLAFVVRVGVNLGLLAVGSALLGRGEGFDRGAAVFFVLLFSLLTLFHDRFLPVRQVRDAAAAEGGQRAVATSGA